MALCAAMVLTTIADPVLLEGYCANFTAYGRLEQVQVIVIPDRKTPAAIFSRCAALRKRGHIRWMEACMRAWVAACRELAAA
jgi:hypothetical protein